MKFCPNCGAQLDDTDKFCTKCGSDVRNITSSQINPQPTTRVEHTVPQNKNRGNFLNNKFKYIIIAVAVICAIGGFGFYKYRTSPAHNPNNPLSNQTITFTKYEDETYLSKDSFNKIEDNIVIKCMKSYHFSPKVVQDVKKFNIIKGMEDSDYEYDLEEKLYKDSTASDKKELQIFGNDIKKLGRGISGELVIVSPDKNLKNGEKVTLTLNINKKIAKKYGIDTTPRVVKVTGLDN